MALFDFLFGSKDEIKQQPTMTPEQEQFLKQLLGQLGPEGGLGGLHEQGLSQLSDLMDPSGQAFQRFADPYMREFREQTVPNLAEKFAGAGAMGGGLSSSGFGQSLSAAGAGLQENLASLRSQLQQKALQDIMSQYQGMSQIGLGQRPFGYEKVKGSPGLLGSTLAGFGGEIGQGVAGLARGGFGALGNYLGFGGGGAGAGGGGGGLKDSQIISRIGTRGY